MIKKISILFIFLFSLITGSFADEQRKVELNDEHNKEIIETTYSKITLKLAEVNENGDVIVDVEFENIDDSRGVLLFAENHDEKALKEMCPKIRYDKKFSGSKGKRVIDACNELENTIHLRPFAKKQIMSLSVADGEVKKITLPIYRVEYKNKNFLFFKTVRLYLAF